MRAARFLAVLLLAGWLSILASGVARATWPQDPNEGNVAICTADSNQYLPSMVSDGLGGAIVFWMDRRSSYEFDLYAQRVSADGVPLWGVNGVAICTTEGDQYYPSMVSDGAGGAIVAWADYRNFYSDIYAQRVSADGVPLWEANGVAVCTIAYHQFSPTIASDGAGGAIVTWQDHRSAASDDLYAQRVSADGVPLWEANGVPICTVAGDQRCPTVVSDGAGGAIAIWGDYRSGTSWDIYGQRVSADGMAQWTTNGAALCTAVGDPFFNFTMVSDGAGGIIVAWQDHRSADDDIYAQRVSAVGVPQWAANGVAVCTDGTQSHPSVVSDGAGGAIITWSDYRSGNYAIYAQRLGADGVPLWTANGVSVSAGASEPTIVSDGAGGAIVTWSDYRNGTDFDLYAQRVSADGVPLWEANGVAVSAAVGDQVNGYITTRDPNIVSDGAGGAIVTWQDHRSGTNYDIYAQEINHFGYLGNPGAVATNVRDISVLDLAPPHPNPARGVAFISFDLPRSMALSLLVFDAGGRSVRVLFCGSHEAGRFSLPWDLRDDAGHAVPNGLYFVRLGVAGHPLTRRIVAVR